MLIRFLFGVLISISSWIALAQPNPVPDTIKPFSDEHPYPTHPLLDWVVVLRSNQACNSMQKSVTVPHRFQHIVFKPSRLCNEKVDLDDIQYGGDRTVAIEFFTKSLFMLGYPVVKIRSQISYAIRGDEIFSGFEVFRIQGESKAIQKRVLRAWENFGSGELGKDDDGTIYIDFEAIRHALICKARKSCDYSIGSSL